MYGTGLILGAGIYVLIGDVASIAGNAMWISFILAAIIAAFTGLSYAELASMFPKSAAEYVYVKNAFRSKIVAFLVGWVTIFVAIVSAAAVAIGFSSYFLVFMPSINPTISAVLLVAALSGLNFIGIRESMWTNTSFALIELAGLVLIIVAGFLLSPSLNTDYLKMPPLVTSPTLALTAILGGTGLVYFAYFGFENLANIAEETRNAHRTIPKALIASIAITTVIYVLVALAAVALVGWEALSSTKAPLAFAAERAFGRTGIIMLSSIALFATSNTVLMLLVSASRIIFGMSSDGALPRPLARIHSKTKTPLRSIIMVMIMTVVIVAVSSNSIDTLAKAAVYGIFIVYAFVNFVLIVLRYRRQELERPFRSPVHIRSFPVLAGLGLVTSIMMLTQFELAVVLSGGAAIALGAVTYIILNRGSRLVRTKN